MFRPLIVTTALIGVIAGTAVARLAVAGPADQIKARHDYFHTLGGAMKGLNDTLRSPAPARAEILKYTATLNAQAPKLVGYFPAGTGLDSGLKTGAKPDIWQKPAEFNADARALADAAAKLDATAHGDDVAAIKAAMSAVGSACKTCHQTFRQEDH